MRNFIFIFGIMTATFIVIAHAEGVFPSPSPSPVAVTVVAQASSNFLANVWHWVWGPGGAILFAVLLGVSESLAAIPGVQANAIYQLIVNGLKSAVGKNPIPQKPSES